MPEIPVHSAILTLPWPPRMFSLLAPFWKSTEDLGLEPATLSEHSPISDQPELSKYGPIVEAVYSSSRPRLRARTDKEHCLSLKERQALAYYMNVHFQEQNPNLLLKQGRNSKFKSISTPQIQCADLLKTKPRADGEKMVDLSLYSYHYAFDPHLFAAGEEIWGRIFNSEIWPKKTGMGAWMQDFAIQQLITHKDEHEAENWTAVDKVRDLSPLPSPFCLIVCLYPPIVLVRTSQHQYCSQDLL